MRSLNRRHHSKRSNIGVTRLLLALTLVALFIVPFSPEAWLNRLYAFFFSAIFLTAAYALSGQKSLLFRISLLIVLVTAIESFLSEGSYKSIGRVIQFNFFILLVILLIWQIAASAEVSSLVIMDAITAYLLLGMGFGLVVLMADAIIPDAYSVPMKMQTPSGERQDLRTALYYSFVTFTTTGYGDIVPLRPVTKSLAILISICGQLYVAIILALLVGKFASGNNQHTQKP